MNLLNKKMNGQFYTVSNPFLTDGFFKWFESIPLEKKQHIIEPFTGSNNIVKMINDLVNIKIIWHCFDINPPKENVCPEIEIIKCDTIKRFPKIKNCFVAITNPPYLAKNSATRNKIPYKYPEYDDLYKKCLDVMLLNCEYVAAIIPESFFTANLFHNRLKSIISLTCKMFDDTECPVCLALFSPENEIDTVNGFDIYKQDEYLGNFKNLQKLNLANKNYTKDWIFNDINGNVGIICCDNTKEASIKFVKGEQINPSEIKHTSRAKTRVGGLPKDINIDKFIKKCNIILNKYRINTKDVFLTSFKGLRLDKSYRRRLDFGTAKKIMWNALEELETYDFKKRFRRIQTAR